MKGKVKLHQVLAMSIIESLSDWSLIHTVALE